MSGWIKLHRQTMDNPIVMKDAEYLSIWVYILLNATHKSIPVIFAGNKIELTPGQLITGRKAISAKLKISESKVQRVLKTLENEQQIERQTSNVNTLITVVCWQKYQDSEQQTEQQLNNKRTTTEQQANTNNNIKNNKNKRNKEINNIPEQVGGNDSKVISIGDSEKDLFNQALKCFYDYYQNHYGTKYNFTAKDGSHLKQLLKKIESKCREQSVTIDNESILNAFQYFISNISDKWILDHFTISILNSKFNEIFINLKQNNYGITGKLSPSDEAVIRTYLKYANF